MAVALTIAGSDPSGGAGIQADLKTFHQFGVYGQAVITLITVQSTLGVQRVDRLKADLVAGQMRAVLEDIPPQAAKTGALGDEEIVEAVATLVEEFHLRLVVDPVMISKHGARLMEEQACNVLRSRLLPLSYLITPNLPEAAALTGLEVKTPQDMRHAAVKLCGLGAQSVLVKGGHLAGPALDILWHQGHWYEYSTPRVETRHTHGTGCTFSAAITACLAKGHQLPDAVQAAKNYIQEAIRTNPGLGHGTGPVNHHASI